MKPRWFAVWARQGSDNCSIFIFTIPRKCPISWFCHPGVGWKGKQTHSQKEGEKNSNEYKLTLCSHFILHVINLWNLEFLAWGSRDAQSANDRDLYRPASQANGFMESTLMCFCREIYLFKVKFPLSFIPCAECQMECS